jgi:hypothetical protein
LGNISNDYVSGEFKFHAKDGLEGARKPSVELDVLFTALPRKDQSDGSYDYKNIPY